MSFINGNSNKKINNMNNFYNIRQGNNYQTPFKINNNLFNNNTGQNIQNNIQKANTNLNYIDTLNKFEPKLNYNQNNNNHIPYSSRTNVVDNGISNNFYYRNYNPYEPFDMNKNKQLRRYDNFHYLGQNNNMPQTEIKSNNNNFDINTIGKIILSTETMESNDKQNKNKAQKEYSDYLKQQIEEKNKRKKLQKEKEMEEDLRLEKQNKEYLKRQKEEMEKEREKEKNKRKNNVVSFSSEKKPINTNDNKKFLIDTDINKNLMENIKRAQTPLISDHVKLNQEISNKYNINKNTFEVNDIYKYNINNINSSRRPVSSTILQSGKGIIDSRNINMQTVDKMNINNNINNNINFEKNSIDNYQNYKFQDFYKNTNHEENTIKNNKYLNFNTTKRNNINKNNLSSIDKNKELNNMNETLFNREKYNINNTNFLNNNKNNNYDFTFKKKEEQIKKEENPFVISESLRGGSIEEILDLNNNVVITNTFEEEKNKKEDNSNLLVTFGPINMENDKENNKTNFESINSNFTFGNNSQLENKNLFGVDSIIKNVNFGALNYFSKYENNNDDNNNKNEEKNNLNNLEQSMRSVSKLISPSNKGNLLSTWKNNNSIKENESIREEIENENINEKEYILDKNIDAKKSLNNNIDLFITFGEIPKESNKIDNNENLKQTLKKSGCETNLNQTSKKPEYAEILNQTIKKTENEENLNKTIKKSYDRDKLNHTIKKPEENLLLSFNNENDLKLTNKNMNEDEYLDSEGMCNFYNETKKLKNEDISSKVNEALKNAKESSDEDEDNLEEINNKLNFFEDTIGKIKKKVNNDIININDRQQLDLIISGEIQDIDTFKSGQDLK